MTDETIEAAGQAGDNDQQEPTMEEILASIRRIISEDGEPVEESEPAPEEEEVLELTNVVEEEETAPVEQVALDDGGGVPEPEPEPQFEPEPEPEPAPESAGEVPTFTDTLVSEGTAQATTGAFAGMTSALHDSRGLPLGHNKTLEDLVKELLRPMLKEWLDANLAPMVQRIVEREVAKLAGRAEDEL